MRLSIGKGHMSGTGANKRQLYAPRFTFDDVELENIGSPERVYINGSAKEGFVIKPVQKHIEEGYKLNRCTPKSPATVALAPTVYGFDAYERTLPSHAPVPMDVTIQDNVIMVGPAPRVTWAKPAQVPVSQFSGVSVPVRPSLDLREKEIKPMVKKEPADLKPVKEPEVAPSVVVQVQDDDAQVKRLAEQVKLTSVPQLHMVLTAWKRVRELNMIKHHRDVKIKFQLDENGDLQLVL